MKEILKCMDKIPQGVFLVGAKKGEGYNLMTAAFVTQVSFNPASIAVSVANNHYTAELIREQERFSLSVLAEGQEAAAKACGFESGRKTDKSKRVQTHLMAPGLPVLDGAAAAMVCRVRQVVKYEDHTVFFAEIEAAEETEAKPLPYVSGDYFPAG